MAPEKKLVGGVCAICGAAILNAAQPHPDCRPVVVEARAIACPPPLFHQPDNPHRHPAHGEREFRIVVATTSVSDTGDLGQLFWRRG